MDDYINLRCKRCGKEKSPEDRPYVRCISCDRIESRERLKQILKSEEVLEQAESYAEGAESSH